MPTSPPEPQLHATLQANARLLQAIGPRLYPEASTGIIELVSNSYDADATAVRIKVEPTQIIVADNGHGMDQVMLQNFFTLGKSIKFPSKFDRLPIGQFGIGKFAMLAMAQDFTIYAAWDGDADVTTTTPPSQREYCRAFFNGSNMDADILLSDIIIPIEAITKEDWENAVIMSGATAGREDGVGNFQTGVVVVLQNLRMGFHEDIIRARVIERMSHTFKKRFNVYVNDMISEERFVHGQRYVIDIETLHGQITGEVIAAPDTYKLGDQSGIRVQVRGRTVQRELFGTESYDETSGQLTGYIDVDWLNDFITPDREGFIDGPEIQSVRSNMREFLLDIIDKENKNRNSAESQRNSKMLNRAVRQVTSVLRKFPNLVFPETMMTDAIPVELSEDAQKAEVVAELRPDASLEANVTAAKANMDKIIKAVRSAAKSLRVADFADEEIDAMDSYSDVVDVLEKMLGEQSYPLVEQINALFTGNLMHKEDIEGARRLVERRIVEAIEGFVREAVEKRIEEMERQPQQIQEAGDGAEILENPMMVGGDDLGVGNTLPRRPTGRTLKIRAPISGQVIPIAKPLDPQPPEQSDTAVPMKIDPKEEGNAEDAAEADIQSYVAVTVESLGSDGPPSLLAEGFGFDGTMIYINSDHHVYKQMEEVRVGFLSFYVAQMVVDEVLGIQTTMVHREKINIKAELLKQMMLNDRRLLTRRW